MAVVALLRRARERSGRTLASVASRAGLSESNLSTIEHDRRSPRAETIDRLATALELTLVPVQTGGRATVAEAGEHVTRAVRLGDTERAYRAVLQLADDLQSAPPYLRLLLAAEPPSLTGSGWDAFIAAVVEWRLNQAGVPVPDWVLSTASSDGSWTPPGSVLPARPERIEPAFLRRGVLVEQDEFASA